MAGGRIVHTKGKVEDILRFYVGSGKGNYLAAIERYPAGDKVAQDKAVTEVLAKLRATPGKVGEV